HRFRRDAAGIDASATEQLALDDRDSHPGGCQAAGERRTRLSRPDNNGVVGGAHPAIVDEESTRCGIILSMRAFVWLTASLALLAASQTISAQQKVAFKNGIPVAPQGLAGRKLPNLPMEFDTGEGQRIRVVAVTKSLEYPWSLVF